MGGRFLRSRLLVGERSEGDFFDAHDYCGCDLGIKFRGFEVELGTEEVVAAGQLSK